MMWPMHGLLLHIILKTTLVIASFKIVESIVHIVIQRNCWLDIQIREPKHGEPQYYAYITSCIPLISKPSTSLKCISVFSYHIPNIYSVQPESRHKYFPRSRITFAHWCLLLHVYYQRWWAESANVQSSLKKKQSLAYPEILGQKVPMKFHIFSYQVVLLSCEANVEIDVWSVMFGASWLPRSAIYLEILTTCGLWFSGFIFSVLVWNVLNPISTIFMIFFKLGMLNFLILLLFIKWSP